MSSCVSSGPASSTRARNSYWPTTLGVIRNVVRLRMPSSPRTIRWLPTGSQSPSLTRCSRTTVASASLQPAGLDDDGQRHRVADEDDRAGLDLGEPDVPRPLVGPGGDRRRSGCSGGRPPRRRGAGPRPCSTGRRSPGRSRRPAGPGARPARPRSASPSGETARFGLMSSSFRGRRRPAGPSWRPIPGRRGTARGRGRAPRGAGSKAALTRSSRGVSRSRSTGDRPPSDCSCRAAASSAALRVVGVRVGEPHALRVVEDDRQVRPHRLAPRRDQHRLDQHGRRRPASTSTRRPTSTARLGRDRSRRSRR